MMIVKTIFNEQWVKAAQTVTSGIISLTEWIKPVDWKGSLLVTAMLGAGTAKITPQYSWDGTTFFTPTAVTDIKDAHLVTSGPGSNGVDAYEFSLFTAPFMRIAVKENNGEEAKAIEAMSAESPCKITVTGHGLSTNDYISIAGITQADWVGCNDQVWQVTKVDDNNVTIAFDASGFETPYNAGTDDGTINTVPIRISALLALR